MEKERATKIQVEVRVKTTTTIVTTLQIRIRKTNAKERVLMAMKKIRMTLKRVKRIKTIGKTTTKMIKMVIRNENKGKGEIMTRKTIRIVMTTPVAKRRKEIKMTKIMMMMNKMKTTTIPVGKGREGVNPTKKVTTKTKMKTVTTLLIRKRKRIAKERVLTMKRTTPTETQKSLKRKTKTMTTTRTRRKRKGIAIKNEKIETMMRRKTKTMRTRINLKINKKGRKTQTIVEITKVQEQEVVQGEELSNFSSFIHLFLITLITKIHTW